MSEERIVYFVDADTGEPVWPRAFSETEVERRRAPVEEPVYAEWAAFSGVTPVAPLISGRSSPWRIALLPSS